MLLFIHASYSAGEQYGWELYKEHFISEDGRVIDYYQNKASHSEGQGYVMLLAVIHDDRELFEKIRQWTNNNLRARKDGLHCWLWGKRANGTWGIIDYNNATDGDILIAYALLEAGQKWGDKSYTDNASNIIIAIREELAFTHKGRTLLLPAYYGFTRGEDFIINPSYLILPAFRAFSRVDDKTFWDKVYKSSSSVLSEALFSSLNLPADWIITNGSGFSVFAERSEYFGYEAIRVLLYLSMDAKDEFPKGIKGILNIYRKNGYVPIWVNLEDNSISLQSAPAGFYAVLARAAKIMGDDSLSDELFTDAKLKLTEEKDDYYSFTLYLLATGLNN